MSDRRTPPHTADSDVEVPAARVDAWRRARGTLAFAVIGLAVIWMVLPRLPADWGIRFGEPYLIFFSLALIGAASFFVLLNWGPTRRPESALGTFASIMGVYGATVGGLLAFGVWYYPQFKTPTVASKAAAGEAAAENRGRDVFLNPAYACFGCHTIEALGIRGGQRGPDLSSVGSQAERRRPGVAAEDYLRESIVDPWACFTPLPASGLIECQAAADPAKTYPQMMPPGAKERISAQEFSDLIAFLKSLRGAGERNDKRS